MYSITFFTWPVLHTIKNSNEFLETVISCQYFETCAQFREPKLILRSGINTVLISGMVFWYPTLFITDTIARENQSQSRHFSHAFRQGGFAWLSYLQDKTQVGGQREGERRAVIVWSLHFPQVLCKHHLLALRQSLLSEICQSALRGRTRSLRFLWH